MGSSETVVFDKAKYHYEGNYPPGLDKKGAYVIAGFFIGWLVDREFLSDEIASDFDDAIRQFKSKEMTAPNLYKIMDGVFASDMVHDSIRSFVNSYFPFDAGRYLGDFVNVLADDLDTPYHVADSWENYEAMKRRIDFRHGEYVS